jgi:hypothetical protein
VRVWASRTSSSAGAGTYSSKVGVAGVVVGDGAGSKVAAGGLLVSCNHCWSVYKHGRLLGEGSLCVTGVALGGWGAGAVSLALRVCGQVGQVVAGLSLEVSEVMRDPVGGGAYNGAKEVGLV